MPRVPSPTDFKKRPNCTGSVWSRSMQARISALSAGSARSPSRLSTGSPGMRCTNRNTSTETPKMANRLVSRRRRSQGDLSTPARARITGPLRLRIRRAELRRHGPTVRRRHQLRAERAGLAALVAAAAVAGVAALLLTPAALRRLGGAVPVGDRVAQLVRRDQAHP